MNVLDKIKTIAKERAGLITEVRRHLHRFPELSFQEFETQKFLKEKLNIDLNIDCQSIGDTGLTGLISGEKEGPCIAIRGDIDALPIEEKNSTPYTSKNPGVMHACGHDVHASTLFGAIAILNELKPELKGQVKFIFQPGEEKLPGGASILIKEGILEKPKVESIFAQHVYPDLEAGKVGFRGGLYMASADEIYMRIEGKGGHAALPHKIIDPVIIAAHLLTSMQTLISRKCDPAIPSVLSFGKVTAQGATNVIPDEVFVEGTFRTMNEDWRKTFHVYLEKHVKEIAGALGGKVDLRIEKGYPCLVNNPQETERARSLAVEYLGSENVVDLDYRMGAEDFAWYSQLVPACFYRLGVANSDRGINSGLHTATFDVDESALETGAGLLAWIVFNRLNS